MTDARYRILLYVQDFSVFNVQLKSVNIMQFAINTLWTYVWDIGK